jgi:hypothetical protein
VEKLDKHHPSQLIDISNEKPHGYRFLDVMEATDTCGLSAQLVPPHSNHEKALESSQLRDSL